MQLYEGQRIAIPVPTRVITHSSGECSIGPEVSLPSNCVMADALRERFPEAKSVDVGTNAGSVWLPDGTNFTVALDREAREAINRFDQTMESIWEGHIELKDAVRELRASIPRVVHGTVDHFSAY